MINEHHSVHWGGMKQVFPFLVKALYVIKKYNYLLVEVLILINTTGRIREK